MPLPVTCKIHGLAANAMRLGACVRPDAPVPAPLADEVRQLGEMASALRRELLNPAKSADWRRRLDEEFFQ